MDKTEKQNHGFNRRKFVVTGLKTAGVSVLLTIPGINLFAARKEYTVQDIIDLILKEIPGAPFKQTVDTIKSGSGDQKVTGIVTTMFSTIEVIKKTAALNANFIIAHEPTYYNHTDDLNWTENNDIVKQRITYGVLKKANWLQYNKNAETTFTIPMASLKQIAEHLKASLDIQHVRLIGDLSSSCRNIALLPGAWGGQKQISTVEKEKPDVLIVGEVHEWETAEYIRDARSLGSKTSLIVLGHGVSEEPGMEWLVDWLHPKLEGIKITHIASDNPFAWI